MNDDLDETIKSKPHPAAGSRNILVPGQIVVDKYKVISILGSGGMGTVYRVEQIFLNKEFALKTMDARPGAEVMIRRFQLEAKAAAALDHPNLVKVIDFGLLENDDPYLVMDFVNGVTFAEHLKKHGLIQFESVAPLFVQACFGLMAAHEHSVVHRDIKPANLMLVNNVPADTEGSVKLVDFGIAKFVNREGGEIQALTRTGEIFGSPLYMSPEQCSSGTVDNRSDIYSLGCVLFEMLTGTPPHMGQNALKTMLLHQGGETPTLKEASLGREFPEELERIVAKMLRKYPDQRYQNAGILAQDLTMFGNENRKLPNFKSPHMSQNLPHVVPPKVFSITSTKLYILLATTGILGAILAGSIFYLNNQTQSRTATSAKELQRQTSTDELSLPVPEDASFNANYRMSETATDTKLLEELPPIKEENVTEDGHKLHKYYFPTLPLGEICHYTFYEFGFPYKVAQGSVTVLENKPVGMMFRQPQTISMLKSPSIFNKIPGKDFQGFILCVPVDAFSGMGISEKQSRVEIAEAIGKALDNLKGWTNLKAIKLKQCPLDAHALVALNTFKKLGNLIFDSCDLDPKTLVKQVFLAKLTDFKMQRSNFDYAPIIKQISTSTNLQNLAVDKVVSDENIHDLRHCSSLKSIQIVVNKIDDESIAALCSLKQLKKVRLFDMTLSDKQIEMLIGCRWLEEIQLSQQMYGKNAEGVRARDNRITFASEEIPP